MAPGHGLQLYALGNACVVLNTSLMFSDGYSSACCLIATCYCRPNSAVHFRALGSNGEVFKCTFQTNLRADQDTLQ